jgi:hypothetical protein
MQYTALNDPLNPDYVTTMSEAGRTLRKAMWLFEQSRFAKAAEQARMAQMWLRDLAEYNEQPGD